MKLLGSLMGKNATGGNMLGSLLKGAMGGGGQQSSGGGALGMLSGLLGGGGGGAQEAAAPAAPSQSQQDQATLLIRAMCNAAKADGEIDQAEQDAIVGRLGGDIDEAEANFLRQELATPLDVAGFARQIPQEMGPNIYAFSVMTVKVDTREEVAYLQQLAQHLNLDGDTLRSIHQQLGLS